MLDEGFEEAMRRELAAAPHAPRRFCHKNWKIPRFEKNPMERRAVQAFQRSAKTLSCLHVRISVRLWLAMTAARCLLSDSDEDGGLCVLCEKRPALSVQKPKKKSFLFGGVEISEAQAETVSGGANGSPFGVPALVGNSPFVLVSEECCVVVAFALDILGNARSALYVL